MKENILELIKELRDDVQSMREKGDSDLRSVLHSIDYLSKKITELN
jgi:hypothetical protein